jgi:NADH:ubiquinone oxidoreductase subunit K
MNLTTFFLRPRILNRSLLAWIFLIIGLIGVWDINSTDNKGIMIIETLLAGFMIAFFYFDKFMQDSKKMAYYLLFKNILHEG